MSEFNEKCDVVSSSGLKISPERVWEFAKSLSERQSTFFLAYSADLQRDIVQYLTVEVFEYLIANKEPSFDERKNFMDLLGAHFERPQVVLEFWITIGNCHAGRLYVNDMDKDYRIMIFHIVRFWFFLQEIEDMGNLDILYMREIFRNHLRYLFNPCEEVISLIRTRMAGKKMHQLAQIVYEIDNDVAIDAANEVSASYKIGTFHKKGISHTSDEKWVIPYEAYFNLGYEKEDSIMTDPLIDTILYTVRCNAFMLRVRMINRSYLTMVNREMMRRKRVVEQRTALLLASVDCGLLQVNREMKACHKEEYVPRHCIFHDQMDCPCAFDLTMPEVVPNCIREVVDTGNVGVLVHDVMRAVPRWEKFRLMVLISQLNFVNMRFMYALIDGEFGEDCKMFFSRSHAWDDGRCIEMCSHRKSKMYCLMQRKKKRPFMRLGVRRKISKRRFDVSIGDILECIKFYKNMGRLNFLQLFQELDTENTSMADEYEELTEYIQSDPNELVDSIYNNRYSDHIECCDGEVRPYSPGFEDDDTPWDEREVIEFDYE